MYNPELKNKFIASYSTRISVQKRCVGLFNGLEKYEEQWGADLCTIPTEELNKILKDSLGMRAKSIIDKILILKDYAIWCQTTGVDGACDGMMHIDTSIFGVDKFRKHTIANPQHLQLFLNTICYPEKLKTTDNIIRCYYWLIYAGMDEHDVIDVKTTDVDFENMLVAYPQKDTVIPIYPQALQAFQNCVKCKSFLYINNQYRIVKDRVEGNVLLRGIRGTNSLASFRTHVSRVQARYEDKVTLKLSPKRVKMSGIFYRVHEIESMGYPSDFNDIVSEQMEGKEYKLGPRNSIETKHRQLVREYEKDYQMWKLAWLYSKI